MIRQKLDSLTWLRGAAAFFVIVNHAILASRTQYTSEHEAPFLVPFDFLNLGLFAVYLFFALSGCTLTISHGNKVHSFSDFVPFYIKRFFRIWPAFFISMVVYLIYIEVFRYFYVFDKEYWIAECLKEYSLTNIVQYLSLTFNITGPRGLFNGPYWTLPVEFQYYLLLPFALFIMRGKLMNYAAPLFFGGALYLIYALKIFNIDRYEIFKMGFSFFGGVVLAKLYLQCSYRIPQKISLAIFVVISFFVGLLVNKFIRLPDAVPIFNDPSNIYGLCAILAVGVALLTKPVEHPVRLLEFFKYYGEISYSTYLYHMIFIGLSTLLVLYFEVHGYMEKLVIILLLSLIGSYYVAKIAYRFIEAPAVELGARIAKKYS